MILPHWLISITSSTNSFVQRANTTPHLIAYFSSLVREGKLLCASLVLVRSYKRTQGTNLREPVLSAWISLELGICAIFVLRFSLLGARARAREVVYLFSGDIGHDLGHADAAYLWDKWAAHQPPHMVMIHDAQTRENEKARPGNQSGRFAARRTRRRCLEHQVHQPCDLRGWWTSSSLDLASKNVTLLYAAEAAWLKVA